MTASPDFPRPLTEQQEWVGELCAVLGWQPSLLGGRAAGLAKRLRAAGGTLAELREHFGPADTGSVWWWYRDAWQGRKGQLPTSSQLQENWGAWLRPVAVIQPASAVGSMVAYVERLRHGDTSSSD